MWQSLLLEPAVEWLSTETSTRWTLPYQSSSLSEQRPPKFRTGHTYAVADHRKAAVKAASPWRKVEHRSESYATRAADSSELWPLPVKSRRQGTTQGVSQKMIAHLRPCLCHAGPVFVAETVVAVGYTHIGM